MENEETEYKPNIRPKMAKTMAECLKRFDNLQLAKGSKPPTNSGKNSMTIGKPELDKVALSLTGSQRGVIGSGQLSSGEVITREIEIGTHGLPVMPTLKEQSWRLIDQEISTEGYDNPSVCKVTLDSEKKWMPELIQINAAMRVCPRADIVLRLLRLKTIRQTKNMDEVQTSVFFGEIADMLIAQGFCYTAIDEGIMKIVSQTTDKRARGPFFPSPDILIEYIYPIYWKMKRRKDKLHEILSRPHRLERNTK